MSDLGEKIGNSFLPNEPSLQSMLDRIAPPGTRTTEAGQQVENARKSAGDDLRRSYAAVFSTPAATRVLEDLFSQYTRRSSSHPNPDAGIEQEALFGRERKGQNAVVGYILAMVHDGRALPAPGAKKNNRKKAA